MAVVRADRVLYTDQVFAAARHGGCVLVAEVDGDGSGHDRFEIEGYASDYFGESGNDTFLSVGFNDYFNGGSGSDTISYQLQDTWSSERGRGRQWRRLRRFPDQGERRHEPARRRLLALIAGRNGNRGENQADAIQ